MSVLLRVENITKTYGLLTVLNGISFVAADDARLGWVGANGVGKSTLLRIIAGDLSADSGSIWLRPGTRVGLLRQEPALPHPDATFHDLIEAALTPTRTLEARLRVLEQAMAQADAETIDAVMDEYGTALDTFEHMGGYDIDARAETLLAALKVDALPRDRAFARFSGGEKTRTALALLLLDAPDLLLLDEPTNHLDGTMLEWLEGYLQAYRGAVLIASHDREFLNRTVSEIAEIDEHTRGVRFYTGSYDAYYAAKLLERRQQQAAFETQQQEIRHLKLEAAETARKNTYRPISDNDKFVANTKRETHVETVSTRVRNAKTRLARLLDDPSVAPPRDLTFTPTFDPERAGVNALITLSDVHLSYGSRCVLDGISLTLSPRSRIALIGANGVGKTTLLRVMVGQETPDSGEVWRSRAAQIGYLAQDEQFDPESNVFDAFMEGLPPLTDGDQSTNHEAQDQAAKAFLLYYHLFRIDDLGKRVKELSLGQQRKLQIARLMAMRANVLILDEPTNHVSFDVLEGLEAALRDFPGAVIAATHDRRFLSTFSGDVYRVGEGMLTRV